MSLTVGDVLRVVTTLAWLDGDLMQNVYNVVIGGTGGPYDGDDILADVISWMNTLYAYMTDSVTNDLDGSEVTLYVYDSVDDDWDEVGSDAFTWNPTNANDYYARGVAALVNANTLDADVQGKKYYGGFTEDTGSDGRWGSGTLSMLANVFSVWATPFVGGASGASLVPVIWSPTKTNAFALTGTGTIPSTVAYQRRRKDNVGI